jgi:hypothetical protein
MAPAKASGEDRRERLALIKILLALVFLSAALPSQMRAQDDSRIVVFDLRPNDSPSTGLVVLTDRQRVFSFDEGDVPGFQADSCREDSPPRPFQLASNKADTLLLRAMSAATSARWIAGRGDTLTVLVVSRDSRPRVSIREVPRQSRWRADLLTLARIALKIAIGPEAEIVHCAKFSYPLQLERSVLELSASAIGQEEPDSLAHELVTGPSEHWYLSADVPFSALRYDGGKLDSVKNPAVFYLGVNYLFGDLLSEDRPSWRNLGVKGVIRLSRDPLESWGLAVTYRGSLIHGIPGFETISPFLGVLSSRREAASDTEEREWEVVFGAGFNLDKALEWVK